MRNYTGLKTLSDHARDQNEVRRQQIAALLSKTEGDNVVIDRDLLISVMHRLGNSSYMIGKLIDEVRDAHTELHIATQK